MKLSGIDWKSVLTFGALKQIVQGCTNAADIKILEQLKAEPSKYADMYYERREKCETCEINTGGQCDQTLYSQAVTTFPYGVDQNGQPIIRKEGESYNGCGCNTHCKAAQPLASCPLGKWLKTYKFETQY